MFQADQAVTVGDNPHNTQNAPARGILSELPGLARYESALVLWQNLLMNVRRILRSITPMRWRKVGKDEPLSMVLLLRAPHFFAKEELRMAAERAWHTSFAGGEGSMHGVVQSGNITLMKAGPHLLSFFHYDKPFIESPERNLGWLPHASQRSAWAVHRACVGVDYRNPETDVEMGYCILAQLVSELIDANCAALYVPRESSLIPNDDSLYLELHKVASARDPGIVRAKLR